MAITKASFNKSRKNPAGVSPTVAVQRINDALDRAEPKAQYDAIKDIVDNRTTAVLKDHFGVNNEDGYITAHAMRWMLINAYNDAS